MTSNTEPFTPILSKEELKALADLKNGPCVSIYMPTERLGPETRQNPVRFKNLVKQAEENLQAYDLQPQAAVQFLQPVRELDQFDFWQQQDAGLAIFLAEDFLRYYRLPLAFEELVAVGDGFQLKPLMPLLSGDGFFYVLALSRNQIRLFGGNRYQMREMDLEGVPRSMEEALPYNTSDEDVEHRVASIRAGGVGGESLSPGSFHGVGNPDLDNENRQILEFFRVVDRELQSILNGQRAPLILTGVEYLIPIYRDASIYPNLVEQGITGNADILNPRDLHGEAWKIVEPYFQQTQHDAFERYQELVGTGKASTNLQEVLPAAYYGRVGEMFVAVNSQCWGSFDPETSQVELHSEEHPDDEELLNNAAIHTLLNGGTVYAIPQEDIPEGAPLAAVFRY